MRLVIIDSRQDIQIFTQYSADRFSAERIDRMLADWQQIVRKILETPTAKVSDFAAILQPGDPADSLSAKAI